MLVSTKKLNKVFVKNVIVYVCNAQVLEIVLALNARKINY